MTVTAEAVAWTPAEAMVKIMVAAQAMAMVGVTAYVVAGRMADEEAVKLELKEVTTTAEAMVVTTVGVEATLIGMSTRR